MILYNWFDWPYMYTPENTEHVMPFRPTLLPLQEFELSLSVYQQCFNRYDQLTSLLHFSGAYHQAPCPEHCFYFTGPPTPQLPLDVYTDPFIEDSLGLLSLFVCLCVSAWLPWATTQCVCIQLCGVTMLGLFLRTTVKPCVPKDKWWKNEQGQQVIRLNYLDI